MCATWHTSKVKNWNDMLKTDFTVGGEGSGSDPDMFATMIRSIFGVKLRLVSGYPGGNEINLAMERGEVDGRCGWSWSSIKITKPDWLKKKQIKLLLQMALHKNSELADVPLIMDLARNDRERQILKLVLSRQEMGWPFTAPPDLPRDRADALRARLRRHHEGPDYLAEAKQRRLEVNPMTRRRDRQADCGALRHAAGRGRHDQGGDLGRPSKRHRANGQNSAISGTPTTMTNIDSGNPSRE